MKKIYITLITALLFSLPVLANTVIVKGYVTFSNNSPAVGLPVYIQSDSVSSPGCTGWHTRYTNANGYYIDTLTCTGGNIVKVNITVPNCNLPQLSETVLVNSNNVAEKNFILGCNPATSCKADFGAFTQANTVLFNASNSMAATGSTIINYFWNFGNGMTASGITSSATYTSPGIYNVRLVIESSNGCRDTMIRQVSIMAVGCHATFTDSMLASNKFLFLSGGSIAGGSNPGMSDSIVQRTWKFGDGTTATVLGPQVNIDHIYQQPGTYNVCLKIFSMSGCIDSMCKTITVTNVPATTCKAGFNFIIDSITHNTVYFQNTSNTLGTNAQYYWKIGSATSSVVNPVYTFAAPGTYNVCLIVYTPNCADSICKTVVIAPPTITRCEAVYAFTGLPASSANGYSYQFTSANSHATSAAGDSIRERIWIWGDGTSTSGNSNVISPVKIYTTPGVYNVCLVIRSASGCSDTTCKTVNVPLPNQVVCSAQFTYENLQVTTPNTRPVKFNSTASSANAGDSIIARSWTFGDGTTLNSNDKIITHNYVQPGTYTVCLTTKTALNCQRTECKVIVVTQSTSACVPHFTWQRTAPKQATFNSSMSWVPVGDSIVARTWNFGDATPLLTGNNVSPVHNYQYNGIYTVSLRIKTKLNCEQTVYIPLILQDSINVPPTVEPIKIISVYPNPAGVQAQFIVWSAHNNVQAELAIYDVYGVKKWSSNKVLLQGNNVTTVSTAFLMPGPYYFRVTSVYGVKTRAFFKR